jgi:hypothetical protein
MTIRCRRFEFRCKKARRCPPVSSTVWYVTSKQQFGANSQERLATGRHFVPIDQIGVARHAGLAMHAKRCHPTEKLVMKKCFATCFAAFLMTTTGIPYAQSGYVGGQPSINCSVARNSVAQILCSGPRAAQADWTLNSAWWALYFSVDQTRRAKLDLDQQA